MLLSISTSHSPATDLSFLLHKHPDRLQTFPMSFGQIHVFYSEANNDACTMNMLLDVDPIGLVRGKSREQSFLLQQYVNDRPFVASSFLSVSISQILGSALQGRCKTHAELASTPIPLKAQLEVLPVRAGEKFLHEVFEPLGYKVTAARHKLDDHFEDWGDSPYYSVGIEQTITLSQLLTHLYVLVPVFDNQKHYFVGQDELDKLLEKGKGWLVNHPLKELIARRFLRHRSNLYREALARLAEETPEEASDELTENPPQQQEAILEKSLRLHAQRHATVLEALKACGAKTVLDLGCGDGKLLRDLLKESQFEKIVGMDVSLRSLEVAENRLRLDRLPTHKAHRIKLIHGSLVYRDDRFIGFDAAVVVEVIEHFDPHRLAAFERVLFEFARPKHVIQTTPNREYNVKWETLPAGQFRHSDHRFEWTRAEFSQWANKTANRFGYNVEISPLGPVDEVVGAPSQMAVFQRT